MTCPTAPPLVIPSRQEVLAMQDAMHPASETFQSTSRVAAWLVEKQLPWLEGEDDQMGTEKWSEM